jgi:hypothetical protein
MADDFEIPKRDADLVRQMRVLAVNGATIRELVAEVHKRLEYPGQAIIPVLWYFTEAFCLPLRAVLPLREWMGTDNDDGINAMLLPAIMNTRDRWERLVETVNGVPDGKEWSAGLASHEKRSQSS